ncbi:MAG: B12-binding domain-containing radical SAM protein [Candidatus Bathyarchaeota archaeon]|nr:B12-binding domain-containing radical SAM protein [Candidatus Bathyarchaeota archaeon]
MINRRGTSVKAHVTLVNPPYPVEAPQAIFIPLGISYLAAVLEENGFEVDVIDCPISRMTQNELEAEFKKRQPDIVGVTSATVTYLPALEVVKAAKHALPNCLTLMGGPHVTVMDEQTLSENPEVDIIVRGEGEQTMLELAKLVSDRSLQNLGEVAGITFRKNDQIIRTPDRPFIKNIDVLPFPAHKHFEVNKYRILGKMYLPIITSRGCPFQCAFCLSSRMCGRGFRARSPSKVVDELEWLRDKYGAEAYTFYDDTFTFDVKRALAICDEMKNRKVNLPWDCRTRVDRISKEVLTKLRNANCQLIHFGIESGSQKMLNAMKKGTTVEQNATAIKWAKEVGMSVAISVVIGYPGETPEMMKQTIDFIRRTEPDYVYMCEAVPYPGTELYNLVKELGWEMPASWNQYHEQTQVFKNPILPLQKMEEMKKAFYDEFFSPAYYFRKSRRKDFYSQIMARTALNHLIGEYKISRWALKQIGKLRGPKKTSGGHNPPSKTG